MSGERLLDTGLLDLTLPLTLWAVAIARDSAPVALMLGAVSLTRFGKLTAVTATQAALTDVG